MKLIAKYIVLLVLIQTAKSKCAEGCLVCRQGESCVLCDFVNAYYLKEGICERESDGVCKLYATNTDRPVCLICFDGYFDRANGVCVKVEGEGLPNCISYHSEEVCSQCEERFLIVNGMCEMLPQPIPDCLVHNSNDTSICEQCVDDYVVAINKKSCVENPGTRYCMHFSFLECHRCVEGTVKHENHYFDVFKEMTDNRKIDELNSLIYDYILGSIDQVPHEICISADIDNCLIYENLNTCLECRKGYYVSTNGKCNGYPLEPLGNCLVYKSFNHCQTCAEGFHVANDGGCAENEKIEWCQGYDGEAEETTCLVCHESHFLVENECEERENKNINKCESFAITEDKCQVCEEDYTITSDNLACFPSIVNCALYANSSKDSTSHVCQKCDAGFFLVGGQCIGGNISNCQEYQISAEICVRCKSTYYLDNNVCKNRNTVIQYCEVYDAFVEDKCEKCEPNAVLFDLESQCKPIDKVDFCDTYSAFDTCSGCKDNYELVGNTCKKIDESEHCINKTASNCTICEVGYYNDSGVCKKIPSIVEDTCMDLEANPTDINACEGCKEGYLPIKTEDAGYCADSENGDVEGIGFCLKYSKDSSGEQCLKCDANKTVSLDGKFCLNECPDGEVAVVGKLSFDDAANDSPVSGKSFKKCEAVNVTTNPELENCEVAAMTINKAGNPLVCIKCKSDSVPTQSCPADLAYFGADDNKTDDLLLSHIAVECAKNPTATFGKLQETTKNDNCLYFKLETVNTNPVFACKSCKFGFTGPIVELATGISEVECVEVVDGCDISVEYNGALLNSEWLLEIYGFNIPFKFSCHKCTSDKEIPFLNLTFYNQLKGYSLDNETPINSTDKNGNMVVCRKPDRSGLAMNTDQFDSFPDNCALGFYSTDRKKSSNGTVSSSVTCLACKNGFKPLKDFNEYMIIGCEEIDNCHTVDKSEGWFNGCQECAPDYAFDFDPATNLIDYQKCVHTLSQNCLAYDSTNSQCVICDKNYTFNKDDICEQFSPENCENFNELSKNIFSKTLDINHIDRAFYFLFDVGCDNCDNGFINILYDGPLEVCVGSAYVAANNFPAGQNNYITHCASYSLSPTEEFVCHKCKETFIPTEDKKKCVDQNLYVNCKIANNGGTSCLTCYDDFSKVNEACMYKNIPSCKTYSDTSSTQTCLSCKDGYYLEDNECVSGDVKNCKVYNISPLKCASCVDGFVLVVENGKGQQCMPIPSDLNCKNATLNTSNTRLECSECKDDNFITTDSDEMNENTCVNGEVIEECAEYDIKSNLQQSTFQCTKCTTDYYLNSENKCSERSYIDGCEETVFNEDVCSKCKENYVFNDDGKCEKLKVGIPNCRVYVDDLKCKVCNSVSYLHDGLCVYIPEDERIQNCKVYEIQGHLRCTECNPGTFLREGICEVTLATNCLVVEDENNCLTCENGWYLYEDETKGTVNCGKSNISGCSKYVKDKDECDICVPHFVVNEVGGCKPVEVEIEFCEVYENSTEKCLECKIHFALSVNQDECIFIEGVENFHNCKRLRYTYIPRCVTCDPGHFFDDGICSPCHGQTFGKGCLYCDYVSNDTCLVCRPGYFMSESGVCLLNQALSTDFKNDVKSVEILGVKMWIILITLFLTY